VGGDQHIAFPLSMVNAAIGESLKYMCDQIDAGKDVDEVIRETIQENQGALFSGDGYSSELYDFAEKSGLFHLKSSPEAYQELTSEKNIKLFTELGIFNEREVHARQNVLLEAFSTELWIEARTLLHILQTHVLPAAMENVSLDGESGFTSRLLSEKRDLVQRLLNAADALSDAFQGYPEDGPAEAATYAQESIKPAMESARALADQLEGLVDRRLWPFPTYSEMLHEHQ
jgi:glutamine synthetase